MTPALDGLLAGLRLALGTGSADADAAALGAVDDWNAVVRLARYHRVGPLLLQGLGTDAARPAGTCIEAPLRRRRDRLLVRGLAQLDALRRAADTLGENDIPCLVLKGLALSQRLHGQPFAREAIDIDVLVPPDAFDDAERALCEQGGWRRLKPDFRETPARKRWHDRVVKDHLLTRPGGAGAGPNLALELHRRLANNPYLLDAPFERLYAHGLTVEIGGYPIRTLGDEDQLPYLACHGLEHFWHRVKWLCDVALLMRFMGEEQLARVVVRCRDEALGCALAPALALCAEALHVSPPSAAASLPFGARRTALVAHLARRAWSGEPPGAWRRIAWDAGMQSAKVIMKNDPRHALHELARLVIAPHHFGRVDVPDALFFLYPVLRPLIWLVTVGQRLRARRRERTA